MNSTLKCDTVVSIKNLGLLYEVDHYYNRSIKDGLIELCKSPLKKLTEKKKYHQVLKDINLEVRLGERVGILGVNGAGKTSLCRCINGMISPTTGQVSVFGKVRSILDTSVGIIPDLTGRENAEILSALLYPELNDRQRGELVLEALEFSELGEFENAPFSKYSKGMQTRLALSIVSAKGYDLLILDEVYDGADLFFQEKVSKRVIKMIQESGAVLFVSHSMEQIRAVCNRLVIIDRSQLIYDGEIEKGLAIYQKFKNPTG